ncbi:uncharacterized protein LOC104893263 [Beta vulgaris subsp. vulgaris]|uniref:uncharacterized protein LOC104893263 n=1 Tax=Beta vulgaris subsp. vulgaris TaxID=3555 RepID=UPI002036B4EC|nr:uncharacterized protein LOC104893263 [Beta vulgaris subsp. vulgaris]
MVSKRGIDANPDKVQAIMSLPEPKGVKDIQRLTGRMAALTRFISKSADKALPFFVLLRGNKKFEWGEEQSKAFLAVKERLTKLPTISRPETEDTLQLYISASPKTVAAVLLVEKEKQQHPIYFISHILNGLEGRYQLIEKMALAVVIAARKLRPYFDCHPIQVLTNQQLEKALQRMDTSERLLKWVVELSEYDIQYRPQTAIKAQALADFITEAYEEDEMKEKESWLLEVDASNNESEYEAAIAGLRMCIAAGAKNVLLKTDSQLVSGQLKGEFEAREANMIKYVEKAKEIIAQLEQFEVEAIPRAENMKADALSKPASSDSVSIEGMVVIDVLKEKSITQKVMINNIDQQGEWFTELVKYKLKGELPADPMAAKKLRRQANWYVIYQNELYKKSFSLPLLKCATTAEAVKIMEEIHEGICGNHIGGKALALKALRAGFYWPSMLAEAQSFVRKCDKCQKFTHVINRPANDLQPILCPIPFAQWGMDILGPFTTATGGRRFLIVGIDYFTKWIEAEPTAKIKVNQVKKFIWENIMTRFGIPASIVFDHGLQFDCCPVQAFLADFRFKFAYSAVCHPQSNGQEKPLTNRF